MAGFFEGIVGLSLNKKAVIHGQKAACTTNEVLLNNF